MITTARYAKKPLSKRRSRKTNEQTFDELVDRAAAELTYRAGLIQRAIAPLRPIGSEELTPEEQLEMLEAAGRELGPRFWDDPEALRDLARLRERLTPEANTENLLVYARLAEKMKRATPDPEITRADPRYDDQMRRLTRG